MDVCQASFPRLDDTRQTTHAPPPPHPLCCACRLRLALSAEQLPTLTDGVLPFRRLRLQGKWPLLSAALHRAERERVGPCPDPSAAIMDSQSVKTVEESACICGYDAHKCVKGRKRYLLVDTLGLPIASYVTP